MPSKSFVAQHPTKPSMTGSPSPNSQELLTTLVQATAELAQSNQELVQSNKHQNQMPGMFGAKIDIFDAKIEAIADQIGKLSESRTAFRLDLDEIKETTRQQAETAKAQAESVSQLIALSGKR